MKATQKLIKMQKSVARVVRILFEGMGESGFKATMIRDGGRYRT